MSLCHADLYRASTARLRHWRRRIRALLEAGMSSTPILQLKDVTKHFRVRRFFGPTHEVRAVDGVSFSVPPGRTFGLVGESGSGKTTIAKLTLLLEPLTSGHVIFEGSDATRLAARDRR